MSEALQSERDAPAGSERDAAAAVDARAADAVVAAADGRHRTDEPTDDVAQARIRSDRAAAARLRLMAVHAHPDDESSKGAATLAKYSAAGVGAMVVSCTGGERGEILNPKFLATDEEMAEIRRREMARAASILGIDHVWLGFVDSGWHEGPRGEWELPPGSFADLPPAVEVEALVRVVRRFRPQVMTTYDENGGYPHPDHLRCHLISVAAFEAAADPEAFPDAGEPWQVLKLYYNGGFSRARITAINEAVRARTGEGPFDDWIGRFNDSDRPDASERVTTRIPVADFYWARDAALRAHETQIDPDSHWFAIPHDLEAEVWGTDDYELARSLVDTAVPEDDLFAGIRERVGP